MTSDKLPVSTPRAKTTAARSRKPDNKTSAILVRQAVLLREIDNLQLENKNLRIMVESFDEIREGYISTSDVNFDLELQLREELTVKLQRTRRSLGEAYSTIEKYRQHWWLGWLLRRIV